MKEYEIFETVVHLIQTYLIDNTSTQIHQNHKMKCVHGVLREFDVVIEGEFNGMDIKIAIECKDYQKKVGIEKIEAFKAKCDSFPSISKRVFVSKRGFQSGAITIAQSNGIELYTLSKVTREELFEWFGINLPTPVVITQYLRNVSIELKNGHLLSLDTNSMYNLIFDEKNPLGINVLEYLKDKFSSFNDITVIENNAVESDYSSYNINCDNTSFLINGKKNPVFNLQVVLETNYEERHPVLSLNSYQNLEKNKRKIKSATMIYESGEIKSFVKQEGDSKIEIYLKKGSEFILIGDIEITRNNNKSDK